MEIGLMSTPLDQHGQPVAWGRNAHRRLERDISELLGLAKGILADGQISEAETVLLDEWVQSHPERVTCWPCDQIAGRLRTVLADGIIEDEERSDLAELLAQLVGGDAGIIDGDNAATTLPLDRPPPSVVYPSRLFVLTGKFAYGTRKTSIGTLVLGAVTGPLPPDGLPTYLSVIDHGNLAFRHIRTGTPWTLWLRWNPAANGTLFETGERLEAGERTLLLEPGKRITAHVKLDHVNRHPRIAGSISWEGSFITRGPIKERIDVLENGDLDIPPLASGKWRVASRFYDLKNDLIEASTEVEAGGPAVTLDPTPRRK